MLNHFRDIFELLLGYTDEMLGSDMSEIFLVVL